MTRKNTHTNVTSNPIYREKKMSRLFCGNGRTITFIWGKEITVVKAFKNNYCSPNIKISSSLALKMYNEFICLGASKII
jgi:hypothetical protein